MKTMKRGGEIVAAFNPKNGSLRVRTTPTAEKNINRFVSDLNKFIRSVGVEWETLEFCEVSGNEINMCGMDDGEEIIECLLMTKSWVVYDTKQKRIANDEEPIT